MILLDACETPQSHLDS